MTEFYIFVAVWYVIGVLVCTYVVRGLLKCGEDFKLDDLIIGFWLSFLGPILILVVLFKFIEENGYPVLIKGRKSCDE